MNDAAPEIDRPIHYKPETPEQTVEIPATELGPDKNSLVMLLTLNLRARLGKGHVYGGTVPAHVVARRRAANKVARRSRITNRRGR